MFWTLTKAGWCITQTQPKERFKTAFFPLKLKQGVMQEFGYFMKKILVCLRKLALDGLPFKSKVLPLCCSGTNVTLVLQGRRACVFPCAWPLFPTSGWTSQMGSEVLLPYFPCKRLIFCSHSSWWEFLDEAPSPLWTSCFITLKRKGLWSGLEGVLTWTIDVRSIAQAIS